MHHRTAARAAFFIRHGLYPLLACSTVAYLVHALSVPGARPDRHHGLFVATLVLVLVATEWRHPLNPQWRMTPRLLLRRDLPFLLLGAATLGLCNLAGAWWVLHHASPHRTWASGLPLLPATVLSLLLTDGLWYALHRASHEAPGSLGRWLWRVHAAHHLPGQVYVLMHAVAHPLNTVMVRLLLTAPPWLLGFAPEPLFAASVVTGVQGLVSHFNVDSRAGWLNHLLVGTELHRWHHAAGVQGNYAAVLSVWDRLFGSFVYRPGEHPARLGMAEPEKHPLDTDLAAVLLEPLRRQP